MLNQNTRNTKSCVEIVIIMQYMKSIEANGFDLCMTWWALPCPLSRSHFIFLCNQVLDALETAS